MSILRADSTLKHDYPGNPPEHPPTILIDSDNTLPRIRSRPELNDAALALLMLKDPMRADDDIQPRQHGEKRKYEAIRLNESGQATETSEHLRKRARREGANPDSKHSTSLPKVTTVFYPVGMDALSFDAAQHASVASLSLPEFAGKILDLTAWPALIQISGSAASTLKEIHLREGVKLSFSGASPLQKITVYVYPKNGGTPVFRHALPSHSYYKTLKGNSEPCMDNYNKTNVFSGTDIDIVCRHMSFFMGEADTMLVDYPNQKSSMRGYYDIQSADDLPVFLDADLEEKYKTLALETHDTHLIDCQHFPDWLIGQYQDMVRKNPEKHAARVFQLSTHGHSLKLLLRYKPGKGLNQYVLTPYDPNRSKTHRRIIETSVESLSLNRQAWTLETLLDRGLYEHYLRKNATGCLLISNQNRRARGVNHAFSLQLSDASYRNPKSLCFALRTGNPGLLHALGEGIFNRHAKNLISVADIRTLMSSGGRIKFTFHRHVEANRANSIAAWLALAEQLLRLEHAARANGELPPISVSGHQLNALTGDFKGGKPALCLALASGSDAVFDSLLGFYRKVITSIGMNAADFDDIITDKEDTYDNALVRAQTMNKPMQLAGLSELMRQLVSDGTIRREIALEFLDPGMSDGYDDIDCTLIEVCKKGFNETLGVLADFLGKLHRTHPASADEHDVDKRLEAAVRWEDSLQEFLTGGKDVQELGDLMTEPGNENFARSYKKLIMALASQRVLRPDHPLVPLCAETGPVQTDH